MTKEELAAKQKEINEFFSQRLSYEELQQYIDCQSNDVRLRATFAMLLNEVADKKFTLEAFGQGLALWLAPKYAPMKIRQSELDKLPPDWKIQVLSGDGTFFGLQFTAPSRPSGIIIPGPGSQLPPSPHRN